MGGQASGAGYEQLDLLWVLNLSDGCHTLFQIAEQAGRPFQAIRAAADALLNHGLLRPASTS
jgi:aminopeptidase-like protein